LYLAKRPEIIAVLQEMQKREAEVIVKNEQEEKATAAEKHE
jgi:hypothetical protein